MVSADHPKNEFKVFEPRQRNHEYSIEHKGNEFYIITNKDKATNFKLMKCPIDFTTSINWEQIIPNREDILLEDIEVFDKFIVLNERKKGLTQFRVLNLDNKLEHLIDMQEESYTAHVSTNLETHQLELHQILNFQKVLDYFFLSP